MISSKNRIFLFDNLRFIAISSVLFIHLAGWFSIQSAEPKILYMFLANISRFAVPMFVVLSASLFFLKYKDRNINIWEYYSGRFKKIVIPYFLVSIIYYIYRLSPLVSPKQKIIFTGLENLFDFGNLFLTIGVFSHLYFVPMIIMFYLFAPFIIRLYKKYKYQTLGALLVINILFVAAMNNLGFERLYYRWTIFPYLIYVIFGLLIADYFNKMKKIKKEQLLLALTIIILGIIAVYKPYNTDTFNLFGFSSYIYDSLFGLFWVTTFLLLDMPGKAEKLFGFISKKSFGIYLFHYLFIDAIFSLISKGYLSITLNVTSFLLLAVAIVFLSLGLYQPIQYLINYNRT